MAYITPLVRFKVRIQQFSKSGWGWRLYYSTDLTNSVDLGTEKTEALAKSSAEKRAEELRELYVAPEDLKPGYSYDI